MARPADDDDEGSGTTARRGLPRAVIGVVVLAGLGAAGFFGARSMGWLGGGTGSAKNEPVLQAPSATAPPVKLTSAPASGAALAAKAASAAGVPQVQVTGASDLSFRRAGVATRLQVLSISSVAFGSDQHMLQIALRADNQGSLPLAMSTAPFRLVTNAQTLAPMDKLDEKVAPGASLDGLITFVVPANEQVRALRVVLAGESQDLLLTQEGR